LNKRLQFLNVDENNKQICYRNCCKLKTVAFFSYRIRVVQLLSTFFFIQPEKSDLSGFFEKNLTIPFILNLKKCLQIKTLGAIIYYVKCN
jgi:hypothetical protein